MTEDQIIRIPPNAAEAESSLIGGLLLDNAAFDSIADIVSVDDFYRGDHREIFEHTVGLIADSRPADAITVAESLDRSGRLEYVGGLKVIANIIQNTPSAANIRRYAEIVRDKAILRRVITVTNELAEAAFNPAGREARDILDLAEARLSSLSQAAQQKADTGRDMPQIMHDVVLDLDRLYSLRGEGGLSGIATGLNDFDQLTSGLQRGDLIILAARPSMGKTALAINIAEHVALTLKLPVMIFSMEMSDQQLAKRMLSSIGRIHASKLRNGDIEADDWAKLTYGSSKLSEARIHIDDSQALTAFDVRSRARRYQRKIREPLGLIIIDYIQMMAGATTGRESNRAVELGEISRALKNLARELNVPVIALSQLSRGVESRVNKRPMMSDLRESGSLEQDSDVIGFLYRDDYYHPDTMDPGVTELIISKQRNGPTDTVKLLFRGEYTRFDTLKSG
ncbi:replicative DNA helicase [Burkholderiaceae bacterium DAT-1]|nr:replicative DNA helicase [Burkholderiaceae bacterium DAT-1]